MFSDPHKTHKYSLCAQNVTIFRRVRKIAKMAISFIMPVPPQRKTRFPLNRLSCNLISGFFEDVMKISVSLKYDNNNRYFTCRPMHSYDNISFNSSQNEKCLRQKLYRKSKHTFYVKQLFPKYRAVYEIMWKNMLEPERLQMTIWRMRIACWVLKATDTH